MKDYDGYLHGGPERWPDHFNVQSWGFFLAVDKGNVLGAAAVAHPAPELEILQDVWGSPLCGTSG